VFVKGEKVSFRVFSEFVGVRTCGCQMGGGGVKYLMSKCEWVGSRLWPASAVGERLLRGRNILAPGCQGLYCSGVVPGIS
jgi:hypothetical protein